MTLTPERKLKKVVIDLMRDPLFADLSGIFMLGTKSVVDGFPTAATNGRDEIYGREFVEGLDLKELGFVVVHESLHKAGRHLNTWAKLALENPALANQAMDYWVNLTIVKRDPSEKVVAMPKKDGKPIGLLDRKYDGWTIKAIFDDLKQQQKEQQKQGGGGQPGDGDGQQGFDEHDWKGAKELTEKELDQLAKDVDQALRQGQITAQRLHGQGGGNLNREFGDILEPKVDWRELLREFVSSTCAGRDFSSWRRPNRRFLSQDIVMPSLVSERIECIAVGSDTSGSISAADHARNLSETLAILKGTPPNKLHMIYWDGRVAGHEEYDASTLDSFATSTKPKGGGGTDPSCMEHYLKEKRIKPDCIIMFTDGYVPNWGNDWDGVPILWCVTGGNKAVATTGKTIHVQD